MSILCEAILKNTKKSCLVQSSMTDELLCACVVFIGVICFKVSYSSWIAGGDFVKTDILGGNWVNFGFVKFFCECHAE